MILITGATGFIGSCLLRELNLQGKENLILVDHEAENANVKKAKYHSFLKASDLFNNEKIWENIEWVFHMGACSSTTEQNWDYLEENNLNFSKKIFELCTRYKIKLIYASSAATYGDGEQGYDDSHELLPLLKPLNLYGKSKHLFDLWAIEQDKTPPFWAGFKFFNVFGPNEYHKGHMKSVVNKAFEQINEQGFVKLFKSHRDDFRDGEQLRDFVYVKDICRAMLLAMNTGTSIQSGIYNMGTGQARTFKDLVSATFSSMEKPIKIDYIPMPDEIKNQYQYFTEAKMLKFQKNFEGLSFQSLENSVKDYVNNHLKKSDIYY